MMQMSHTTRESARKELAANGYVIAHRPPHYPECWGKPGEPQRFAVGCRMASSEEEWLVIDYPDMEQFAWLD